MLPLLGSLLLLACGSGEHAPGDGGASTARPGRGPTRIEHTHGECTFEATAPEPLALAGIDGISFTLESDAFSLQGFAGTTLYEEPNHPLDLFEQSATTIYRGRDSGLPLAIVRSEAAARDPKDKHAVSGAGGEPASPKRPVGCRFLCDGLASREAEVIAFCKSVTISVAAPRTE